MIVSKSNPLRRGDIARFYDFIGNLDCYAEGVVSQVLPDGVEFVVLKDVWEGKRSNLRRGALLYHSTLDTPTGAPLITFVSHAKYP